MTKHIIAVQGLEDQGVRTSIKRRLVDVYPEWKEKGYIVRVGDEGNYKVLSTTRSWLWHEPNIREPQICDCEHYEFNPGTRKPCIHVKLAMLDDTGYRKRQKPKSKEAMCGICGYVVDKWIEIHDFEHPALSPGDKVCTHCAPREGVA